MDDDIRRLLGLPDLPKLAEAFWEEIPNHESGLSPRQMHKLRPDVDTVVWMAAAHWLFKRQRVFHSWRPLAQPACAAQESVYTRRNG